MKTGSPSEHHQARKHLHHCEVIRELSASEGQRHGNLASDVDTWSQHPGGRPGSYRGSDWMGGPDQARRMVPPCYPDTSDRHRYTTPNRLGDASVLDWN